MSTHVTTLLSNETATSLRASLASLNELGEIILAADQASSAVNDDDGVETVLVYIESVCSNFNFFDELVAQQEMSPRVIELLTEEIVPALADLANEFKLLWGSVLISVTDGGKGMLLVDDFLKRCTDVDGSAMNRLQAGLLKALSIIRLNKISEEVDMLL